MFLTKGGHPVLNCSISLNKMNSNIKVNVLKFPTPEFLTKSYIQTLQTQIRLLLKKQLDCLQLGYMFVIPVNILRKNCIKSKIFAKKKCGIKCLKL